MYRAWLTGLPRLREDAGMKRRPKRPKTDSQKGRDGGAPQKQRPAGDADTARLQLRRLDGNQFALQPPVCARDRKEDLDEVRQMLAASEFEIARDELLYLVADCRAFLDAHNLLAELALEEDNVPLARGHFGFAYEIGLASLPEGFRGLLPANRDYNRAFFFAGRGLARCLIAGGKDQEGRNVLEQLLRFDPRETDARRLLEELASRQAKP